MKINKNIRPSGEPGLGYPGNRESGTFCYGYSDGRIIPSRIDGYADILVPDSRIIGLPFKTMLNSQQIAEILPQAYPFIMIDSVVEFKKNESLTAIKNITGSEWIFEGQAHKAYENVEK